MNGLEATAYIRKYEEAQNLKYPSTSPIPVVIIALTAHVTDAVRESCMKGGMNEFITKPFKPQALLELLASHVEKFINSS